MKSRKKQQKRSPVKRRVIVRHLRDDCVEYVQQMFNFKDKERGKTWDRASEMPYFSCPTCGGVGSVTCTLCDGDGERQGKWCSACDGMGEIGCEDCEGGVVPNWPSRNLIYPLPPDFDRPDGLAKQKFNYIIIVKTGTQYALTLALPEWAMRSVNDMPAQMIEAYITLGFLPPARLVCRLLGESGFDYPGQGILSHCHRSLVLCSHLWAGRLKDFEKYLLT